LAELGDKLGEDARKRLEESVAKVKESLTGTSTSAVREAADALQKIWHEEAGKMYSAAGAEAPPAGGTPNGEPAGTSDGGGDGPVDADFEVVDEDKK
jgi:molecular chaperone DnaK